MVGFPPEAFPLVTVIWPEVPVIVVWLIVVPLMVTNPVPEVEAKLAKTPVVEIVGLPEIPSPLVIERPDPVTEIVLLTTVFASVLTWMPAFLMLTKDSGAPVKLMVKVDPAPPSAVDNPDPVATYRLEPKALVAWVIKNGYVVKFDVA